MAPLRIGHVRYLNTTPLVAGLSGVAGVQTEESVPADLARLLTGEDPESGAVSEPRVDVCLASLVDCARSRVPLALLPCGMIGCDGPTLTVRLFSRVPMAAVRTLHADVDSHTSVVLARLVLARAHGARPAVAPLDGERAAEANAWPDTVLLIGDKAVTAAPPPADFPHGLDLGEAWHALTGLPFVYAMWMVREADLGAAWLPGAAALLDRQRRRNAMRLDWLVAQHALRRGWPADLARTYLRDLLRYEVGEREREAVRTFLSMAADEGFLPRASPRFVEPADLAAAGVAPAR